MINPTTDAITEFAIPTANADPFGITTGPDGNLWFAETGNPDTSPPAPSQIGEINPTTRRDHRVRHSHRRFRSCRLITAGPDGNLWFAEQDGGGVAGKIGNDQPDDPCNHRSHAPNANGSAFGITAGPDGNLWFTDVNIVLGGAIGVINPTTDAITEYPDTLPNEFSPWRGITAGPDGNIWFTDEGPTQSASTPSTHIEHTIRGDTAAAERASRRAPPSA